jgi:NAD(P)-dependent dehydrogenase (short-subunit alcohol dehydrogenase family)
MPKDSVVVVSGGAGGIGRAIAWLFARLGAHVAVVGRDRAKLDALVAQLASRNLMASAHTADIRDPDAVKVLFDAVWSVHGRVMGFAEHPGELCGARRDRDRRLEGLYAGSSSGLPPFKSDDARGFALGHRASLRLPRRDLRWICDGRNGDCGQLWGETWTTGKLDYFCGKIIKLRSMNSANF